MTVGKFIENFNLKIFNISDETREIKSGYACDLLSWVIGRAEPDCAFITIMSNINVIAVGHLAEVACIILCENVEPDNAMIERAKTENINLLGSQKNTFDLCAEIGSVVRD